MSTPEDPGLYYIGFNEMVNTTFWFFVSMKVFFFFNSSRFGSKKATRLKVTVLLMKIDAIPPMNLSPVVEHVFTPSSAFGLHIHRCTALLHGVFHLNQLAASNG